jgi:hypothetical protein
MCIIICIIVLLGSKYSKIASVKLLPIKQALLVFYTILELFN